MPISISALAFQSAVAVFTMMWISVVISAYVEPFILRNPLYERIYDILTSVAQAMLALYYALIAVGADAMLYSLLVSHGFNPLVSLAIALIVMEWCVFIALYLYSRHSNDVAFIAALAAPLVTLLVFTLHLV